ncbi:hypothetical protein TraAM80_01204 [Trypanosoma rangeli]|uniref:VASt domain-containing protein n=1 Tax=Trypanosoma rangeli TaxID=5698 RepID=A0A422NZS9_TRYRA|nr:uncharacterized protein TraAM80_01204 [Trypanosoma rangeli]RNF10939.1 hypothetical protein TraAM80_01204 [Trypanosoma rangeli]|eukprot:RNF10939.1 hypothetical protein TraAM80_01204 [Trypanosoma rangeli]
MMPETIRCISGVEPGAVLAKQQYSNGVSQSMFSPFEKLKDKKCMIAPTLLKGVTIARLWGSAFANSSDFLKRYHYRRKETDLHVGKWMYMNDMGSGYRTVSLVTVVDVPRVGSLTQLNEVHRFAYTMSSTGTVALAYQISSQTPGVPAGQSFRTEAFLEITADSLNGDCTVGIWGGCKKMSLAFSAIQYVVVPRAIREMTNGYRLMLQMISEDLVGDGVKVSAEDEDGNAGSQSEGKEMEYDDAGDGDASQAPSVLFQGLMLMLAIIVTVSLLGSMSTLRNAFRITNMISAELVDGDARGGLLSSSLNSPRSSGTESVLSPLTQDQALRYAARDAQIQSLRYRWVEQRVAIHGLEVIVGRLWWMNIFQLLFMGLLVLKMFVF